MITAIISSLFTVIILAFCALILIAGLFFAALAITGAAFIIPPAVMIRKIRGFLHFDSSQA